MGHEFTKEECIRGGKRAHQHHPELKKQGIKNFRKTHTPKKQRERSLRRMRIEKNMAKNLREEGWEIFSPTAVCDRIGIKDGNLFFLEFKKQNQQLTSSQLKVQNQVPFMYKVLYYPS